MTIKLRENPNCFAALATLGKSQAAKICVDDFSEAHLGHLVRSGCVRVRVDDPGLIDMDISSELQLRLSQAWFNALHSAELDSQNIRLCIDSARTKTGFLASSILAGATGVESVFFGNPRLSCLTPLCWPLRVGYLPDQTSIILRQKTADMYYHKHLLRIVEIGSDASDCDLLLLPTTDHINLLDRPGRCTAALVIACGENITDPGDILSTLVNTGENLGAGGVALVSCASNEYDFFSSFIDELSHNYSVDIALTRAAGSPHNLWLVAGQEWVASSSLVDYVNWLEKCIGEGSITGKINAQAAIHIKKDLGNLRSPGVFESESREASEIVRAVEELEANNSPIRHDAKTERWLQAQVYVRRNGTLTRTEHAFVAGFTHALHVRIAPSQLDWIKVSQPFPYLRFKDGEAYKRLTVVLDCAVVGAPTVGEIWLPPMGASRYAELSLDVPSNVDRIDATLTVLHEGRLLQSAVLKGPVATEADTPLSMGRIELALEDAMGADLEHQTAADLTIVDHKDSLMVQFNQGGSPYRPDISGIEVLVTVIREELFNAAQRNDILGFNLRNSASLNLIRMLAIQGAALKNALFELVNRETDTVNTVEVISQISKNAFPVEFLYDFESPDGDADLCPGFLAGTCGIIHSDDCSARRDPVRFVCPSGFWGLNRIIGRQLKSNFDTPSLIVGPLAGFHNLQRLDCVLVAASHEVDAASRAALLDSIKNSVGKVVDVDSWEQWVEQVKVKRANPPLLVILPHNEMLPERMEALEIGQDQYLRWDRVKDPYVLAQGCPAAPMLLLLGCNTATANIGFQDFIGKFRKEGAAVVVGTITYVLGQQAAPVAGELVQQLSSRPQGGSQSLGEVMRDVRCTMLRQGNVMCLTLVAYGDRDWRFV